MVNAFAFTSPLPFTVRPTLRQYAPAVTAPRAPRPIMTANIPSSEGRSAHINEHIFEAVTPSKDKPTGIWNGITKLVRLTALSATLLLAPGISRGSAGIRRVSPPVAMASSSATTSSNSSDVEAAAMTLGAVTLGGLCMRVILSRSRDEAAEKAKLEAECQRLAEEERQRALRAERKRLESVEGDEQDDQLWSAFRKRVESLDSEESDQSKTTKNDNMRHNPIPDRGMGSAVLDRPDNDKSNPEDNSGSSESDDNDNEDQPNSENLAKPDELEMLKRMWNLSSDKE